MSTILDALKKSEQERKLNSVPTLSDMPAPQEVRRWPWIVMVLILLVLLLVIVIGQWQWNWFADETPPSNQTVVSNQTSESDAQQQQSQEPVNAKLVVNVVSYSEDPQQRFAMINGRMFRENEFVKPGVKVEKINIDSVELNERGQRVTRQP